MLGISRGLQVSLGPHSKANTAFQNNQFLTSGTWRRLPGISLNISQLKTAQACLHIAQQELFLDITCYPTQSCAFLTNYALSCEVGVH